MAVAYIFAEKSDGAAESVTLAKGLGFGTTLVTVGNIEDSMLAVGADSALCLKGESPRVEAYAKAVASLMKNANESVLLATSSPAARELCALVAGILDCAMISDVQTLSAGENGLSATRSILGGAVEQVCEVPLPCVATLVSGIVEPGAFAATQIVQRVDVECDNRVRRMSFEIPEKTDVDLSKAGTVVCVGMGIDDERDVELAKELAGKLEGAIGCTRDVAEGRKLLPKSAYIGITGVVVKPSLYLSMGVSGQLQHIYGIRDSKVVAAIDKNKDAPIFRNADYGIVGDLHDIVPRLIAEIG